MRYITAKTSIESIEFLLHFITVVIKNDSFSANRNHCILYAPSTPPHSRLSPNKTNFWYALYDVIEEFKWTCSENLSRTLFLSKIFFLSVDIRPSLLRGKIIYILQLISN